MLGWLGGVGGVGGVCTVIFMSNLTTVEVMLRLSWDFDTFDPGNF